MPDPIRLGIIGCGKVAWERHYPALRRASGFAVRAVCDVDAARANRIAALYGAGRTYSDFRELAGQGDIDAIAVLTPTGAHAETGVAVLEAGKHLFMEKPLALTLAEAERLIEAQRKSGRVAQVCFNLRWHRLIRQAKSVIESGALGRVKAIRSVYTHDRTGEGAPAWHRKVALGGGVGFNEGVHHYDLWRHLLGLEIQEVHSYSVASEVYEDETSVISASLDGGVLGSGVLSFLTGPNSEVEVYGDKGRLLISLYRFDGLQFYSSQTYPGAHVDRLKRGAGAILSLPGLLADARNGGGFQATFSACWQGFERSVRTGQPPGCTLEDGRRALEIALAAARSLESDKSVTVREAAQTDG